MLGVICLLIAQNQGFFAKAYGTTRDDYCFSVIETQDQGYAMSGYSGGFFNNGNFLVMKTDSTGALVWAYEYYQSSVAYDEFAWPIVQAADGSYYVAGHGFVQFPSSSNDIVLLKLNSDGAVQWAKSYGSSLSVWDLDYCHTMTLLSDGGLAIAGHTIVSGQQDIVAMKLTPAGNVVWAKKYADVFQDHGYGVIQASDGGIIVVGFTQRSGSSDFDILVIKLDGFGNTLWAKAYGTSGQNDYGYSAAQLADGDIVVSAYLGGYGGGVLKIRLSDGTLLWTKAFTAAYLDYAYRPQIIKTSDGGFLVPAFTDAYGNSYQFLLLKMASNGTLEWAKTFGGTNYDIATSVFQKPDGRFVIAGVTNSYGAGGYNFALLVLQSDGSFPGACVYDCSPPSTSPTLSTYTLSSLTDWVDRTDLSLSYERSDPGVSVIPICEPLYENEHKSGSTERITCSPFPGGALFLSPEATGIRIYKVDGRLAYSGQLEKGENRISLDRGVYFWITGGESGRVAVR